MELDLSSGHRLHNQDSTPMLIEEQISSKANVDHTSQQQAQAMEAEPTSASSFPAQDITSDSYDSSDDEAIAARLNSRTASSSAQSSSRPQHQEEVPISPLDVSASDVRNNNLKKSNNNSERKNASTITSRTNSQQHDSKGHKVMKQLEKQICKKEEEEVMQYLMKQVHIAEDIEYVNSMPTEVQNVQYVSEKSETSTLTRQPLQSFKGSPRLSLPRNIPDNWKIGRRRRRQDTFSNNYVTDDKTSRVEDLQKDDYNYIRQKLPKYIPLENGTYLEPSCLDDDQSLRLFHRSEFAAMVLSDMEKKFPVVRDCPDNRNRRRRNRDPSWWKATLSESHPNDPNSYLLEAEGTQEVMNALRIKTQAFIRSKLECCNKQRLLDDPYSLVIDLSLNLQNQKLGAFITNTLKSDFICLPTLPTSPGVWLKSISPQGAVGQCLIGPGDNGEDSFQHECVILSINDQTMTNADKLRACMQDATRRSSATSDTKVTLCLSKYADFGSEVEFSKWNIRRRDGNVYDPQMYEYFKLNRCLKIMDKERVVLPPSWFDSSLKENKAPMPSLPKSIPKSKESFIKAYKKIMHNDQSIEIDLVVSSADGDLGVKVEEISTKKGRGLYLHDISKKKLLGNLLGEKAIQYGAVLWKVMGNVVVTAEEFYACIQIIGGGNHTITLVLFDGIDLSMVDKTRLAQGKNNPRRRTGEIYPLNMLLKRAAVEEDIELETPSAVGKSSKRMLEDNASEGAIRKRSRFYSDHSDESEHNQEFHTAKLPKRKRKSGYDKFREFQIKFKELVKLDYRDTKIIEGSLVSSMWHKHKQLFGENKECSSNCKCLSMLPALSENIISDYIKKQKGKSLPVEHAADLEARVCGVMKNFAPHFIDLLKDEYPNENSVQLIGRLIDMWKFHQRSRIYGMYCRDNCECQADWEQVFGKGDKAKAEEIWNGSTKKRAMPKSFRPTSNGDEMAASFIPKRKRHSAPDAPMTTSSLISSISRESSLRRHSEGVIKRNSTLRLKTFEVAFDASLPLGGYFRTEPFLKNPAVNIVRIYSIYPGGQLAKHARIKQGTIVQSVLIGEKIKFIATHEDLKMHYYDARKKRMALRLMFEMQTGYAQPSIDSNWNSSGSWISSINDGWAGGVDDDKIELVSPKSRENAIQKKIPEIREEWTKETSSAEPKHKTTHPKRSCLSRSKKKRRAKISFSDSGTEEVIFEKDDPSNIRRVKISSGSCIKNEEHVDQISFKDRFIDSVRNPTKTYRDLVDLLSSGSKTDSIMEKDILNEQYNYLKGQSNSPELKLANSIMDISQRKKDLKTKYAVLKILLNCNYFIRQAMSLTKWYELTLQVDKLEMSKINTFDFASDINALVTGKVSLKCGVQADVLGSLPMRNSGKHFSYKSEPGKPFIRTTHNNSYFGMDDRIFVIDVEQALLQIGSSVKRLGSFVICLDDIERSCPSEGSKTFVQAIETEQGQFFNGQVEVTARKTPADKDCLRKKRDHIMKELRQQIHFMQRFNQDHSMTADCRLTADISVSGGVSLLHAAIQLLDNGSLIEAMIQQGADPRKKSHLGTPLNFAMKLLDLAKEKEKNLESKKESKALIDSQRERCGHYGRLVEILQRHAHRLDNENFGEGSSTTLTHLTAQDCRPQSSGRNDDLVSLPRRDAVGNLRMDEVQSGIPCSESVTASSKSPPSHPMSKTNTESTRSATAAFPPALRATFYKDSSDTREPGEILQRRGPSKLDLPTLTSPNWVELNRRGRRCKQMNNDCIYFSKGACRCWHDVQRPLSGYVAKAILDGRGVILPESNISLLQRNNLWTSALIDDEGNRFIYPHDIFQVGFVSRQGIIWFLSKEDALDALHQTIVVMLQSDRQIQQLFAKLR